MKMHLPKHVIVMLFAFLCTIPAHAQSLTCQDSSGQKAVFSGVTICPFGLKPVSSAPARPIQQPAPQVVPVPNNSPTVSVSDPDVVQRNIFLNLDSRSVLAIQTDLKKLGYPIALDGISGSNTEMVIKAWQRDRKVSSTGFLDTAQIKDLQRQAAAVESPLLEPAVVIDETERKLFASRQTKEILSIQKTLTALGFKVQPLTGTLTRETEAAIKSWQKSKFLPTTGYLTSEEIDRVMLQGAQSAQSPAPAESALLAKYKPIIGGDVAKQILEADPRDLIVLFNETETAPNGVRGLSGKVEFKGNQVRMCLIGGSAVPPPFIDWMKIEWTRQGFAVENFNLSIASCNLGAAAAKTIESYDVFAIERRLLTNNANVETQMLLNLSQLIRGKMMSLYSISEWTPYEIYQESRKMAADRNLRLLKDGKLEGYGVILTNPDKNTLCGPIGEDKDFLLAVSTRAVQSFVEPNIREKKSLVTQQDTAEAIFVAAKRRNCGFVIGSAAYLKPIVLALERDGIITTVAPHWLTDEQAANIEKDIREKRRTALQSSKEQQDVIRKKEEENRKAIEAARVEAERKKQLEAERRLADEKVRKEELARLRKLVESRGQSIVDGWNTNVRKHIASVDAEILEIKDVQAQRTLSDSEKFKRADLRKRDRLGGGWDTFAVWQLERAKEGWEFGDTRSALEDYGLATWRGRKIESVSVKIELPMTNRVIGERKTECWNFVWINDEEFSFRRQMLSAPCGAYSDAFKDWAVANDFISQWKM
jgi:peptidoglycan hydrolase-like protein with peptidoglycan-binding domain